MYGAVCLTPKPNVLHADLCWPVFQRSPWNIERDGCSVLTDTCFLFTYRFGRNITEQKTVCLQLYRYVDWVAIFVWAVGLFLPFSISITFGSVFVQVYLVECSAPFKLSQFKSSKEFLKVFGFCQFMILDYRLEYKIYCKYWREKAGFKILKNYCQTWSYFNKFCCDVYSLCMFQRDAYEDLMTKAQSCPTVSAVSGICVLWS